MSRAHKGSTSSYVIGFLLSLLFTIVPYLMVTQDLATGSLRLFALAAFAVAQIFVQLLFFLHLGQEKRPRLHSMAFGFMTMVVVIVVFGSLWIMSNLDYHMMSGHDTDLYIQDQEAITPDAR